MYADMLCAWANAPIKGQHMLLGALLLSSLPPDLVLTRASTPAQRLIGHHWTSLNPWWW